MNELGFGGWLYFKTNKETKEEAFEELLKACKRVGVELSESFNLGLYDDESNVIDTNDPWENWILT